MNETAIVMNDNFHTQSELSRLAGNQGVLQHEIEVLQREKISLECGKNALKSMLEKTEGRLDTVTQKYNILEEEFKRLEQEKFEMAGEVHASV